MEIHELTQKVQALEYRNGKLKALNRKMQIQLSDRDKRITELYKKIEELTICGYCKGVGYDPHQNHDTTLRPCPECNP